MKRITLVAATLLVIGSAPGCDSLVGIRNEGVIVRTDQAEYDVHESTSGSVQKYSVSVTVRIENRSMSSVVLETCGGGTAPIYGVELLTGPEPRESAFNPFLACGASTGIRLAPGASRVYALNLSGPNMWDGETGEPFGSWVGAMRLRFFVQSCSGGDACEPAVSNTFIVN